MCFSLLNDNTAAICLASHVTDACGVPLPWCIDCHAFKPSVQFFAYRDSKWEFLPELPLVD
jgi:hypothetical protein